jgi:hypothetical protein
MHRLLKQGIEQEMQRKGYRKVPQTEQADINISFAEPQKIPLSPP